MNIQEVAACDLSAYLGRAEADRESCFLKARSMQTVILSLAHTWSELDPSTGMVDVLEMIEDAPTLSVEKATSSLPAPVDKPDGTMKLLASAQPVRVETPQDPSMADRESLPDEPTTPTLPPRWLDSSRIAASQKYHSSSDTTFISQETDVKPKEAKLKHLLLQTRGRTREAIIGLHFYQIKSRKDAYENGTKKDGANSAVLHSATMLDETRRAHAEQRADVIATEEEGERSCSPMDIGELPYVVDVPGSFEQHREFFLRLSGLSQEDYTEAKRARIDKDIDSGDSRKRRAGSQGGRIVGNVMDSSQTSSQGSWGDRVVDGYGRLSHADSARAKVRRLAAPPSRDDRKLEPPLPTGDGNYGAGLYDLPTKASGVSGQEFKLAPKPCQHCQRRNVVCTIGTGLKIKGRSHASCDPCFARKRSCEFKKAPRKTKACKVECEIIRRLDELREQIEGIYAEIQRARER